MSSIYLVANEVLFTSYGHLQLVFDADDIYFNGGELELEVQGPFLAIGDWDVRPQQAFATPFGADSLAVELSLGTGQSAADIWTVLGNTRDSIASQAIDYRLGLVGAMEGQNSNSYITTLAHVAGLDIAGAITAILATPTFTSFPGLARNVLFDHVAADDSTLPPVTLDIDGSGGADSLSGGDGADRLRAGDGDDSLNGFGGADILSGGQGRDRLSGGDGSDTLGGDGGRDRLHGDAGDDVIVGGTNTDRLFGGDGDDILEGGKGADRLKGHSGLDALFGGTGKDMLNGGRGSDTLSGGQGHDVLIGGKGNDILTGGEGADAFVFNGARREGRDMISDFQDGLDLIRISGLTFPDLSITGTDNARIELPGGTRITLTDVAATDLGSSDFDFV